MASVLRRTSTMSSLFLCYIFLLSFASPSLSGILLPSSSSSSSSSSGKVSVGLYYESLCPYSASFIVNHLVKLFDDDLISIVDLHLSPWGNTKLHPENLTFACQHGPYECFLDTVEACAIEAWPELSDHFRFIFCVESLVSERKYDQWETCYEKLKLNSKPIDDCLSNGHGTELELQYAAETNALQPPHEYVPWVVVDGQPLYEDYENFISYICKAYKGNAMPVACNKNDQNDLHKVKLKRKSPVNRKGTQRSEVVEPVKLKLKTSIENMVKFNTEGLI